MSEQLNEPLIEEQQDEEDGVEMSTVDLELGPQNDEEMDISNELKIDGYIDTPVSNVGSEEKLEGEPHPEETRDDEEKLVARIRAIRGGRSSSLTSRRDTVIQATKGLVTKAVSRKEKEIGFGDVMERVYRLEDVFRYTFHKKFDKGDKVAGCCRCCCTFSLDCCFYCCMLAALLVIIIIGYVRFAAQPVLTGIEVLPVVEEYEFPHVAWCVDISWWKDFHYETLDNCLELFSQYDCPRQPNEFEIEEYIYTKNEDAKGEEEFDCVIFSSPGDDLTVKKGWEQYVEFSSSWEDDIELFQLPVAYVFLLDPTMFKTQDEIRDYLDIIMQATHTEEFQVMSMCQSGIVEFGDVFYDDLGAKKKQRYELKNTVIQYMADEYADGDTYVVGPHKCTTKMIFRKKSDKPLLYEEFLALAPLSPITSASAYLGTFLTVLGILKCIQLCGIDLCSSKFWKCVRKIQRKREKIKEIDQKLEDEEFLEKLGSSINRVHEGGKDDDYRKLE